MIIAELPRLRAKRLVDGEWKPVGSFIIDVRTKAVGRIAKASGVFPDTRNGTELIQQIKMMLRELDTNRDVSKLTQIKQGKVHLLDALAAWKAGRLNFAESYAGDALLPSLHKWLDVAPVSAITIKQYRNYIARLERMGMIAASTKVRDCADVLRAMRTVMAKEHKAVYFGNIRQMFMSYLVNHLGYDAESHVLRDVKRILPLKVKKRREHHPLRGPRELIELGARINTGGRWGNREVDYKSWIYFMALTGMRPTEFERGLWERDTATGHLRIRGTKTRNAVRVIPLIMWLEPAKRTLGNLQMRLVNIRPPTVVRTRDFRRTSAVWYEQAGVPRSRYSYYLGHGPKDMTALYESRTPSKEELDADRTALLAWLDEQKAAPPVAEVPSALPEPVAFIAQLEEGTALLTAK
jgi:integrase